MVNYLKPSKITDSMRKKQQFFRLILEKKCPNRENNGNKNENDENKNMCNPIGVNCVFSA